MRSLADLPARPRGRRAHPAYPSISAIGFAMAAAACATQGPEAQSPSAARVESTPVRVVVEPGAPDPDRVTSAEEETDLGWSAQELVAAAPARFPEDDEPAPSIGCGGACPPAYVLATRAKDNSQIVARVRYCAEGVRRHWPTLEGLVTVSANIDEQAQPHEIEVQVPENSPAPLGDCIRQLVQSVPFGADPPFARSAHVPVSLGEKEPEE